LWKAWNMEWSFLYMDTQPCYYFIEKLILFPLCYFALFSKPIHIYVYMDPFLYVSFCSIYLFVCVNANTTLSFFLRQSIAMLLRLASNLWSSCLSHPSAGITDMYHHHRYSLEEYSFVKRVEVILQTLNGNKVNFVP
jgi:hypothetical protein